MRMRPYLLLFVLMFSAGILSAQFSDSRIQHQVLVMLQPQSSLDEFTSAAGGVILKEVLSTQMKIYLLENKDGSKFSEEQLQVFNSNKVIRSVQYNHGVKNRSLMPNDANFANQWNMHNTGQTGGFAGADIDAASAWEVNHSNLTKSGDTIVVAVIDDYFDTTHVDLNFYTNPHEIPGDGIDNDGNGYIDDIRGWNAYDNNANVQNPGFANHPNHVSGIIGAKGNNSIGVAGVCWGVKILPVAGSSEVESDVIKAYAYVIAMRRLYNETGGARGAFIVASNSSFGTDYGKPADFPIWCSLYDSMGILGIISATSTANLNINVDNSGDIPTTCPSKWMVAVNSTESHDYRVSSGYGAVSIDMGAPGQTIYSTVSQNNYSTLSGTSMASPHVAGTLAAMFAEVCPRFIRDYKAMPDSMALIMRQWLLNGVEVISRLKSFTATEGRVNLYRSVMNTHNYNCDSCSFSAEAVKKDLSCNKANDGAITLSVVPAAVYQYAWSDTNNNASRAGLKPGFYGVSITDAADCSQQIFLPVNEPDTIIVTGITVVAPTANPGNIIVNASAGSEALTYSLNDTTYQAGNVFVINTPGDYTIHIKNKYGCKVSKSITVSGLNDVISLSNINIYPNPADGLLNLNLAVNAAEFITVNIADLLGRICLQKQVQAFAGQQLYTIDVSQLQDGLYALQIPEMNYAAKIMVKH
jgi:hypothetical protein